MELVEIGGLPGKWIERDAVAFLADADAGHPRTTSWGQLQRLVCHSGPIEPKLHGAFTKIKAHSDGAGRNSPEFHEKISLGDWVVHSNLY